MSHPILSLLTIVSSPLLSFSQQQQKKQAICFTAFLVGFITVLCIGNYFRAKRAQDRQRQRRLAKLADDSTFVGTDSNGNPYASTQPPPPQQQQQGGGATGAYAPPRLSPANATIGVQV